MTVGWRSPLGGPRYDGEKPGEDPQVDGWREQQIESEIEKRREAEAVAGLEDDGLRADGSGHAELREGEHRDDDNVHRLRNDAQHEIADKHLGGLEEIHVGDHVRDRERDDPTTMLVVATPLEQADKFELDSGQTVADVNDDYPADADVVEVVFPGRTDVSTRPLKRYAYPRSRLERVAAVHGDNDE